MCIRDSYRAAAVGYVTPLRDGMNLVAKEFVAAQDPAEPGVLLLSRFAGAAAELRAAVLTNPYHADGVARDLDRALRMGLPERQERHRELLAVVSRTTAATWAEDFLETLFSYEIRDTSEERLRNSNVASRISYLKSGDARPVGGRGAVRRFRRGG